MEASWALDATQKCRENKITKTAIAKKIGWSREYVSKLFHGKKKYQPSIDRLIEAIDELVEEKRNAASEAK